MDKDELIKDLAHLQKDISEVQIRLVEWTIETADDREALREDIRFLRIRLDFIADAVGLS